MVVSFTLPRSNGKMLIIERKAIWPFPATDAALSGDGVNHDEAGCPDLIHAGVRVGHIGKSSWRYGVGLFRNKDNNAFAEGFFAQVQVSAVDEASIMCPTCGLSEVLQ